MTETLASHKAWLPYAIPVLFSLLTIWASVKYRRLLVKRFDLLIATLCCLLVFALDIAHVFEPTIRWVPTLLGVVLITTIALSLEMRYELVNVGCHVRTLGERVPATFSSWDNCKSDFQISLRSAKNLWVLATLPHDFVDENFREVREILDRGGNVRLTFVDPGGSAFRLISRGREDITEALVRQLCTSGLPDLVKGLGKKSRHLEVRKIDFVPPCITSLVDAEDTEKAVVFATITGYRQRYPARPSFRVVNCQDPAFAFLKEEFKWVWSQGSVFELPEA